MSETPMSVTKEGLISEGAWPISSYDVSRLVGEILTLVDGWSENSQVTKARKDVTSQAIYRWFVDKQMTRKSLPIESTHLVKE